MRTVRDIPNTQTRARQIWHARTTPNRRRVIRDQGSRDHRTFYRIDRAHKEGRESILGGLFLSPHGKPSRVKTKPVTQAVSAEARTAPGPIVQAITDKPKFSADDIQKTANSIVDRMNNYNEPHYRFTINPFPKVFMEFTYHINKNELPNKFDLSLNLVDANGLQIHKEKGSFIWAHMYDPGYAEEAPFYAWLNRSVETLLNKHADGVSHP